MVRANIFVVQRSIHVRQEPVRRDRIVYRVKGEIKHGVAIPISSRILQRERSLVIQRTEFARVLQTLTTRNDPCQMW